MTNSNPQNDEGNSIKPTARIRPAKDGALWLFVDAPGVRKNSADDLNEYINSETKIFENSRGYGWRGVPSTTQPTDYNL